MKKILYIVEATSISGAGKCAQELIFHLKNSPEYKLIVITQFNNDINKFCDNVDIENYALHYARTCSMGMGILGWLIAFFCRPLLNVRSFRRLKKLIDLNQIHVIHSNAISIDFGAYIFKKTGIPHIWHIRDFLIFNHHKKCLIPNFYSYINNYSTKIITVSNALKNFCTKHNIQPEKLLTIYDGIRTTNYFNIGTSNPVRIVCVGDICENKGQNILINAVVLLKKQSNHNFSLDFYGRENRIIFEQFKEIIHNEKLDNSIHFHGYKEGIQQILSNYDIGIQPSHSEGFSLVTAEYMAAGLCVIAANEGAIPELIIDKETGFLYEDYNSSDLKDKIIYCIEHPEEITRIREKAYHKAAKDFSINKNLDAILDLYNKTI